MIETEEIAPVVTASAAALELVAVAAAAVKEVDEFALVVAFIV